MASRRKAGAAAEITAESEAGEANGQAALGLTAAEKPPSADLPDFARERLQNIVPTGQTVELQRNERLAVYDIPIDLIDPTPTNPQTQDDETFNELVEEMDDAHVLPEGYKSPGMIEPVLVVPLDNGRFQMISGEHRWRGFKTLGKTTIPGILLTDAQWKLEEFREFMVVRMNALRGTVDADKFYKLYKKHEARFGNQALRRLFAFADKKAWDQLTGGAREVLTDAGVSKEFLADFEAKTKEVKTVDDLAGILNGLFRKYGDTLRWSYMVFAHGGREHLYIRMSDSMAKRMDRVKTFCREKGIDINDLFEPVVAKVGDLVDEQALAGMKNKDGAGKDQG